MKENLTNVIQRIRKVAVASGRNPETVRLVAVTKTVSADRVAEAIAAGVTILGENYVQEAREKVSALSCYPVSWHFIGHLQTNKAKYVVTFADLIHSVDSLKLAQAIDKQAKKINKVQEILIQVNIGEENSKSGISVQNAQDLIKEISTLRNLSIKGLMVLPPFFNNPEKVRPYFVEIRNLRDRLKKENISNVSMNELSMGMTGDFEAAIEEGATLVRIGTRIFGERITT